MEPRGEPRRRQFGCRALQDAEQTLEPPPVGEAASPDVLVVGTRADEFGERELVEGRGLHGDGREPFGHGPNELLRQDHPAQAHARGERLARRAEVCDVLGGERLDRADGAAVVAELAVVVVFDEERPRARGPARELGPPSGVERDAERELVGGRQEHGVETAKLVWGRAAAINGQRGRGQAALGEEVAVLSVPVGLDPHAPRPARMEHRAKEPQALREAGAHDDPLGRDPDAPRAGQVGGEG